MNKVIKRKLFVPTMRSLHRDIGFLLIGLTLIYCVSGIIMIYRDTGFLKFEQNIVTTVDPGLSIQDLASALKMRKLTIDRQEGDIMYFNDGEYSVSTGQASYTVEKYPLIIEKLHSLHLSPSSSTIHIFGLTYGILLLFLAISSLFMFKSGTRHARRGLVLASVGVAAAFLIVAL